MRALRYLLIALSALMLLAPAALAAGPSAGDQQYTDPLGGSNGSHSSSHSNGSGSGSGSGSSSSTPASSSSSTSSPSASTLSPTAAPAISTPTATTAQATTGNALPRTGFDAWEGAAFGLVLLGAGFAVRRQVNRPLK